MSQLNFDANSVEPSAAFDPLPPGWYPVMITESELKPTQAGTGKYLQLELTVNGGEFSGRKVFDRLNIDNPNPTAQEIAYRTLSSICHATGVIQVQASEQLHNIPMEVKLTVQPAQGEYDASNNVKGYRKQEGSAGAPAAGGAPTMGAPAGSAPQMTPPQAASPGAPGIPSAATPPAPAAEPVYTMTPAAGTYTRKQYLATEGWSDELLVEKGFMTITYPQPTSPASPASPAGPGAPAAGPGAPDKGSKPEWAQHTDQASAAGSAVGGAAPAAGATPGTPPWAQGG